MACQMRWHIRARSVTVRKCDLYDLHFRRWRATDVKAPVFWRLATEKMHSMEDAWRAETCDAVVYLDADLVITAPVLDSIFSLNAEVLLTPHYFQRSEEDFAEFHADLCNTREGYYNSGFVLATEKRFPEWWKASYYNKPGKWFGDQICLNETRDHFSVAVLDESANIGFWSSPFRSMPLFRPIPLNCKFLHCRLFSVDADPGGMSESNVCAAMFGIPW